MSLSASLASANREVTYRVPCTLTPNQVVMPRVPPWPHEAVVDSIIVWGGEVPVEFRKLLCLLVLKSGGWEVEAVSLAFPPLGRQLWGQA